VTADPDRRLGLSAQQLYQYGSVREVKALTARLGHLERTLYLYGSRRGDGEGPQQTARSRISHSYGSTRPTPSTALGDRLEEEREGSGRERRLALRQQNWTSTAHTRRAKLYRFGSVGASRDSFSAARPNLSGTMNCGSTQRLQRTWTTAQEEKGQVGKSRSVLGAGKFVQVGSEGGTEGGTARKEGRP
jgi:hypothetical protein